MGSCAAPSAKGDDKFITTDYLQQCHINDLGLIDDTKQIASPWVDWVCGSAVRQGLPAKITKI
ncbi:hypothetical protein QP020_10685 [Gallibacterium anatis]|uniref:hypothetical protein n=1 Tax=Gallibacterium anatis TaxID=750 RepID=UPI00254B4575|nr:hypothetical protein [Gallibacterium anatis]WIM84193.1 hypothetical protein QP020_10685 [Gallibacterium anatis]